MSASGWSWRLSAEVWAPTWRTWSSRWRPWTSWRPWPSSWRRRGLQTPTPRTWWGKRGQTTVSRRPWKTFRHGHSFSFSFVLLFVQKKTLPPFRQSYYIIFLHLILKKTCTLFIYMYLLGASSYNVNLQIVFNVAIACHYSGETEEVIHFHRGHFNDP